MGAVKFVNFQMLTRNGEQWAWVYARQGHSLRIASLAGVLFVATQAQPVCSIGMLPEYRYILFVLLSG